MHRGDKIQIKFNVIFSQEVSSKYNSSLAVEGDGLFHGAHAVFNDLCYVFGHLPGYAFTLVHELLQYLSFLQHTSTAMHQLHRQTIILIELLVLGGKIATNSPK